LPTWASAFWMSCGPLEPPDWGTTDRCAADGARRDAAERHSKARVDVAHGRVRARVSALRIHASDSARFFSRRLGRGSSPRTRPVLGARPAVVGAPSRARAKRMHCIGVVHCRAGSSFESGGMICEWSAYGPTSRQRTSAPPRSRIYPRR
jgi:hypothetical protein